MNDNNYILTGRHLQKLDELISELQCVISDIFSNHELSRNCLYRSPSNHWVVNGQQLQPGMWIEVFFEGQWKRVQIEIEGTTGCSGFTLYPGLEVKLI